MEINLVQDPTSLCRRECLVQARPVMRVQVILHQSNLLRLGVMHVDQLPNTLGIIASGTAFAHLDVTPAPQGFAHQQLVAYSLPLILIIDPGPPARARPLGW